MTKRAAAYDINEHTYEETQRGTVPQESNTNHMAGRKIYKISRPLESGPAQSSNITLKIHGLDQPKKSDQGSNKGEKTQQKDKPVKSIFDTHNNGIGLFTNNIFTNIFSKKPSLASTTLNDSSKAPQASKKEQKSQEISLKQPVQTKPEQSPFASIFSKPSTNIFSDSRPAIFGGGLFSQNKPFSADNGAKGNQQEDAQGDSQGLANQQNMANDPSKSQAKFEYTSDCKVLWSGQASKFKKDSGDLVEKVLLSVMVENKSKLCYLTASLKATKTVIYSGLIIPHKSTLRLINNKAENMQILLFSLNKQQLQAHRVKIQINDSESAVKCAENIEKVIAGQHNETLSKKENEENANQHKKETNVKESEDNEKKEQELKKSV